MRFVNFCHFKPLAQTRRHTVKTYFINQNAIEVQNQHRCKMYVSHQSTSFDDSASAITLMTSSTRFRKAEHFSLLWEASLIFLVCLRATTLFPDLSEANAKLLDLHIKSMFLGPSPYTFDTGHLFLTTHRPTPTHPHAINALYSLYNHMIDTTHSFSILIKAHNFNHVVLPHGVNLQNIHHEW